MESNIQRVTTIIATICFSFWLFSDFSYEPAIGLITSIGFLVTILRKSQQTEGSNIIFEPASNFDSSIMTENKIPYDGEWKVVEESVSGLKLLTQSSVGYNGAIYIFGGYRQNPNPEYSNLSLKYTPATRVWEVLPPMITPRGHASSFVIDDIIYVVGGSNKSGAIGTVEAFDPKKKEWKSLNSMSKARSFSCASNVKNKIYVLGGQDYGKSPPSFIDSIEEFDVKNNKWSTLPVKMTQKRRKMSCQELDGKLYLFGGDEYVDGEYIHLDKVESLDLATHQWDEHRKMNSFRIDATSVKLYGNIYIIGGVGRKNACSMYNPNTDEWTELARLNIPRYKLSAAVVEDQIYVIGGRTPNGSQVGYIESYFPKLWH